MSRTPLGRLPPSSIIQQPNIAGQASTVKQAPTPPGIALPRVTASLINDPIKLARYLNDLVNALEQLALQSRQSIFASGNAIRNYKVTAGTTYYVAHQLGRRYAGAVVTRALITSVSAGVITPITERSTYPANKSIAVYFGFTANFTGTLDLFVY